VLVELDGVGAWQVSQTGEIIQLGRIGEAGRRCRRLVHDRSTGGVLPRQGAVGGE
jgi:hypothetical protein